MMAGKSTPIAIARLDSRAADFAQQLGALTRFEATLDDKVERIVAEIITDVRRRGDTAVVEHTNRLDRQNAANIGELEIHAEDLALAHAQLAATDRAAL